MSIGTGFIFSLLATILGAWAIWQRRTAWGWWETPITVNVILLAIGAVTAVPIFFLRNEVWWWGHSYMLSIIVTFTALANFGAALKRRETGTQTCAWTRRVLVIPTAIGVGSIFICYLMAGALVNSWVLAASVDSKNNVWVRAFWMGIAILLTYQLTLIGSALLKLRKDPRRTDKKAINFYLLSCAAGLTLAFTAILASQGYGDHMAIILVTAVLTALLFAGQAGTSAWSWRRKTKQGTQLSYHRCQESAPSSPQLSSRCFCQHGSRRQS